MRESLSDVTLVVVVSHVDLNTNKQLFYEKNLEELLENFHVNARVDKLAQQIKVVPMRTPLPLSEAAHLFVSTLTQ